MARRPRIEIVQTRGKGWQRAPEGWEPAPDPFHVRQVASNGRIQWSTETYTRRRDAERALLAIARGWWGNPDHEWDPLVGGAWLTAIREGWDLVGPGGIAIEVRHVDERADK